MSDNVELVKAVQKVSEKVLRESRHELLSSVSNVVPKFSQMLLEKGLITCTDQRAADLADDSVFERYVCGIARHCKVYEVQKHCEGLLEILEELSGPPRDAAVALRSKLQSSIAREAPGVDFHLLRNEPVVATFPGTASAILTKKTFSKAGNYKDLEKELVIHQATTPELSSATTSAEACSETSMQPLHHFADQSPASIHSTLSGNENENDSNSDEQLEHPYENAQGCTSPRPIPTYNEGAANIDEQYSSFQGYDSRQKKINSESNDQFSTQQQIQLITAYTQFSISRCQMEMQQHQQQLLHHQQQAQINLQNKPHQQQQEQHHYHQQQLRNRQSSQNVQQASNRQNEHLQESNQLGLVTQQEQHNQQQIASVNNQPEHVQDLQQQLVLTPFLWFLFAAILVYNIYLYWDKVI